jgi:ABC-type Fe3+-siderophore transport system permease subunit
MLLMQPEPHLTLGQRLPRRTFLAALTLIATAAALLSVTVGAVPLGTSAILAALSGTGDPITHAILFELRLPRALLALGIGAMLGIGGAALQGFLRNPLAEPSLLGASTVRHSARSSRSISASLPSTRCCCPHSPSSARSWRSPCCWRSPAGPRAGSA